MKKTFVILASLFAVSALAAEKYEVAKPVDITVTAKKVPAPSKSNQPAVKDQKASIKSTDAKTTAK